MQRPPSPSPILGLFYGWTIAVPRWMFLWLLWNLTADAHAIFVAYVMHDLDAGGLPWVSSLCNASIAVLLSPVVNVVQTVAMISCLVRPARGFAVIQKS
jgi:hypothetical protein